MRRSKLFGSYIVWAVGIGLAGVGLFIRWYDPLYVLIGLLLGQAIYSVCVLARERYLKRAHPN